MKRRTVLICGALLLALGGAGVLWFLSPAGSAWRVRRMDLPSLVSYTARYPQDANALRELAQRMERQDLLVEALNNYLQSTQAQPKNAEGWIGAARLALRLNDIATATQTAQQAVQLAPGSVAALWTLGQAYARAGNWELAQTAFQQAVERDPNRADLWDALAETALKRENLQEAQKAALKATQLDARQAAYWYRLALVTRRLGDLEGAKSAIVQALRNAPEDPQALTEQGIELAQSARSPEERDAARQALQAIVDRWPGTPPAYEARYELGQVLLAQGRPAEAQKQFRACLQIRPNDEAATFALSRALALEGKSTESQALLAHFEAETAFKREVAQLQMRIRRQPQQADLYTRLEKLYALHGDQESARQAKERLLQIQSNSSTGK